MGKALPREDTVLFIKTAEKGEKNLAQTHAILSDTASKIDERGYPFYQFVFPSLFDTVSYTTVERHPNTHSSDGVVTTGQIFAFF